MNDLKDLVVGDQVMRQWRNNSTISTIERITKTQIIVEGGLKFNKKTGRAVGSSGFSLYHVNYIYVIDEGN